MGTEQRQRDGNVQVMTKALVSLPSLALITTLALSGCSLSIGGGSSSQAQSQETQVGSDTSSAAGSAKGSTSAPATGTTASTGQAVAGYEPGQIPPIPMFALPDLSLLTQSTGAFTPDLTRSITSQPGVTVRPARCDASGSLVSGSTVLGGDGSMTTSSGSTAVTNNGDGSGTFSDGKVSIVNNGDGSGTYSDGKVSIVVNGDGSGTYSDDHLSVTVNGDGSGTYSDSATGESIVLGGDGSGTYSRGEVSIVNNGDGSGTYSDATTSIVNEGTGSAIVNGKTVSAKPVPKAGKVGTFPSIDAAKPAQSCGTVITLEDGVLFDFGKSEIRPEAAQTIKSLATVLSSNKVPAAHIYGHTDSISDEAFNLQLSQERADVVMAELKKDGVSSTLDATGYGESKPVAPNENADGSDNPSGRALNRRVEIFIPAF